jgi:hypothetical protein
MIFQISKKGILDNQYFTEHNNEGNKKRHIRKLI